MNYCKIIFNKDIYDLNISDIQSFFDTEQEESSILEFKSGKVEIDEIYREISAFLNTEGGVLIIGAPQEQKVRIGNKEKRICKGELIPSNFSNQDNLIRSISSNITPSPYKIRAKELQHNLGKIFIIEVPQSLNPPHQVNNEGKYYIRLERDSKAAPHGIVEALFFKRQKPDLNVTFEVTDFQDELGITQIQFIFSNESFVTAENIGFICQIDGIAEIIEKNNVNKNIEIKNEQIYYQDSLKDTILVKGISLNVGFSVKLKNSTFLMNCSYWCKDTQVETKTAVFETKNGSDFVKWFNSKNSEQQNEFTKVCQYYEDTKKSS